jgi:hypothetical protein
MKWFKVQIVLNIEFLKIVKVGDFEELWKLAILQEKMF